MSLIAKHVSTRLFALVRLECSHLGLSRHSRWASDDAGGSGSSSYLPQWVRNALPSALGGDKDTLRELEGLTMDAYLTQITAARCVLRHSRFEASVHPLPTLSVTLSQAHLTLSPNLPRKLGSISGSAFGAKASDPGTQGFLRSTELVIGALTPEEKGNESLTSARVAALSKELDLTVEQIHAVMGRYRYTKHMMAVLAQRKREGKELPKSIEEVEQLTGNWRSFIADSSSNDAASGGQGIFIPANAVHPKGGHCGLAGMYVGRSTKCPRYRKSFKACCGKGRV